MTQTYDEAKQAFIAALPDDPPAAQGRRQRPRVSNTEEKWYQHMVATVCGAAPFAACTDAPATIEWSESHYAHNSIGGGAIVEKTGGFPASEAASEFARTSWVLVAWSPPRVGAMTVEEAFKRGLNEVEWPGIERKQA